MYFLRTKFRTYLTYMRSLAGCGGVVSDLTFVIVTPSIHFPITGAGQTVEGATRYVHHLLVCQCSHNSLGHTLVGVVSMPQPEIVTFTPVIKDN